jgi:hypothetical protein
MRNTARRDLPWRLSQQPSGVSLCATCILMVSFSATSMKRARIGPGRPGIRFGLRRRRPRNACSSKSLALVMSAHWLTLEWKTRNSHARSRRLERFRSNRLRSCGDRVCNIATRVRVRSQRYVRAQHRVRSRAVTAASRLLGMQHDLGIAFNALVELLIRLRRLLQRRLVRDDETGLGAARDDHIA